MITKMRENLKGIRKSQVAGHARRVFVMLPRHEIDKSDCFYVILWEKPSKSVRRLIEVSRLASLLRIDFLQNSAKIYEGF